MLLLVLQSLTHKSIIPSAFYKEADFFASLLLRVYRCEKITISYKEPRPKTKQEAGEAFLLGKAKRMGDGPCNFDMK